MGQLEAVRQDGVALNGCSGLRKHIHHSLSQVVFEVAGFNYNASRSNYACDTCHNLKCCTGIICNYNHNKLSASIYWSSPQWFSELVASQILKLQSALTHSSCTSCTSCTYHSTLPHCQVVNTTLASCATHDLLPVLYTHCF